MSRRAAMLLLLATTGCTGLDGSGPNSYNAGLYDNGYAAGYPSGYGPAPGYAGPETYYAPQTYYGPPAYAPVFPAPGVIYGGGGRPWDHDRHWDHDRDRDHDRRGEEHRGGTPPDIAAQRQREIMELGRIYNQQRGLQQQQPHNQPPVVNPQNTPVSRAQLIQELANRRQQLDRDAGAIRRREPGR